MSHRRSRSPLGVGALLVTVLFAIPAHAAHSSALGVPKVISDPVSFVDVAPSSLFHDQIMWLASTGVSTGWTGNDGTRTFRPLEPVRRDAMAAFLYRLAGEPDLELPSTSPFVDVATDNMFYKEISWLAEVGVSRGWDVGNGLREFRPLQPVNRDAMAVFLYRFAEEPTFAAPRVASFSDVPVTNVFFREISWLMSSGVSTGWQNSDGTHQFRPLAPVARDAMAAFMYRFDTNPEQPTNPGDSVDCADFASPGAALNWFNTYWPYYGDVARLDLDNDGVPCQDGSEDLFDFDAGWPSIFGEAVVGEELHASPGSWTPVPDSLQYSWLADGVAIPGAIADVYTPVAGDVGRALTLAVTGSRSGYVTATVYSDPTNPVREALVTHDPGPTITSSTTWTAETTPVVVLPQGLHIAADVELRIEPGVIVKMGWQESLVLEGRLTVAGTSARPVIFTSLTDDSAGGDHNVDGPSAGQPGDWRGIFLQAEASLDMEHAETRFGTGIADGGSFLDRTGEFRVANSQVEGGISLQPSRVLGRTVSITDNIVHGGVSVVTGSATSLRVTGNTVSGSDDFAIRVRDGGLRPSLLTGNSAVGNTMNVMALAGTLAEDWTVPREGLPVVVGYGQLTVPAGLSMTVHEGTVIKFTEKTNDFSMPVASLQIDGRLEVVGASDAPAVFTALRDDSVGGDTNGDGDAIPPYMVGDLRWSWGGIAVGTNGSFVADHLIVRSAGGACASICVDYDSHGAFDDVSIEQSYSGRCLLINAGATGYFHGALDGCNVGIEKRRYWGETTTFDATRVLWGAGGPPGLDGNPQVWNSSSGAVRFYPWAGTELPAPVTSLPPTVASSVGGTCADVVFIGMMGSGERSESNIDFLGSRVREIYSGAMQPTVNDGEFETLTFTSIGIDYEANPVPIVDTPDANAWEKLSAVANYVPGAWDGSVKLLSQLQASVDECGDSGQQILLAGYSQGAWAVHAALGYLAGVDSPILQHIGGVALLADPLRATEVPMQNLADAEPGDGFAATYLGFTAVEYMDWIKSSALSGVPDVPNVDMSDFSYPSELLDRSLQVCKSGDAVCDTGSFLGFPEVLEIDRYFSEGAAIHGGYTVDELRTLGAELRRILIEQLSTP